MNYKIKRYGFGAVCSGLLAAACGIFSATVFFSSHAYAQGSVYRCVVDGKTAYLDRPCPSGAAGREVIRGRGAPSLPVCSQPVEPLLRYMNRDNERFLSEIARICPGARVTDRNMVAVLVDGKRTEFRLSGPIPLAAAERETIYNQYQAFDFDGFNWKVLSVKRMSEIGRASNPQKPANGTFVVVELQLRNISDKPRYYGSSLLLGNNTQYPASSMAVYLKEQMGYDDNKSTQFQPGSVLKTYMVFDAGFSSEYILVLKEWVGDRQVKVRVSR